MGLWEFLRVTLCIHFLGYCGSDIQPPGYPLTEGSGFTSAWCVRVCLRGGALGSGASQRPRPLTRIHCCHESSWWPGLFCESFPVKLDLGRCLRSALWKREGCSPAIPVGPLSPWPPEGPCLVGLEENWGVKDERMRGGTLEKGRGFFGKLIIAQSSLSSVCCGAWRTTSICLATDVVLFGH